MQTLKTIYNFNTFLPNVPFDPPENIGKPKVSWRFQGGSKTKTAKKMVEPSVRFFIKLLFFTK